MSNWIKIDDDLYCLPATPDPQDVVSISALESEIADLQSRIDSIHLIEIPKDASDEVAMLVAQANEFPTGEKFMFETRLKDKQNLLNELKAL
jgi:hypothetical protein